MTIRDAVDSAINILRDLSLAVASYRADAMQRPDPEELLWKQTFLLAAVLVQLPQAQALISEDVWRVRLQPLLEATRAVVAKMGPGHNSGHDFELLLDLLQEGLMLSMQLLQEAGSSATRTTGAIDAHLANRQFFRMFPGAYDPFASHSGPC